MAYHEGVAKLNDPTSLLRPPQKVSPLVLDRVTSAKQWLHHYALTMNHGVKEENLLKLLMPLGIESHEIDLVWLADITSWATTRGEYAHRSGVKITTLPDPSEELAVARKLLDGFKEIDRLLAIV